MSVFKLPNARRWIAIVLSAVVVLASACKQKEKEGDPPDLPPLSSFVMDFDAFPSTTSGREIASAVTVNTTSNYGFAAINVGVWNTLIKIGLAVPVGAFVESFKHKPSKQSDGSWVWSYDVLALGAKYTASLHRSVPDGTIHWDMYVSKQGAYTNFNWYSGVSDLDRSHGTWTLNASPDDPTPLLGIEWNYDATAKTGNIKYTNVVANGAENGGYIYYGVTADPTYDAFYDIYNKGADDLINIQWNRASKAGRVKNPKHFGTVDWNYWDSTLQDAVAP